MANDPFVVSTGGANGASGGMAGAPAVPSGTTLFAQNYGDEGEQALAGLAVDAAGNVYVAGNEMPENIAQPRVFPGPGSPTQGTTNGAFLLQYSSTGVLRWRQPFPAPADPNSAIQVNGVAVQATTGTEILVGTIRGTVTVGDVTLSAPIDPQTGVATSQFWLTSVDSAGYVVWTKLVPTTGFVAPAHVFVTASGDIEVTGAVGDGGSFVGRFSPTGDPIWSNFITNDFSPVMGAAVDADGGFVLGSGAVVMRLDPQGNRRWVQTFVNTSGSTLVGAGLDPSQNVIVYGEFNGTLDLGGGHVLNGPPTVGGMMDGVIAKLDPDGTTLWAQQIPGGLGAQPFYASMATDAAGNIALINTGDGFNMGPSFGGVSPLPPQNTLIQDFGHFIVKFAPDGTFLWTRGFVTQGSLAPPVTGLAFDSSGRLAAAGNFDNTVDFGTGPLTVPGQLVRMGSGPEWVADNVFTLLLAP
jgi:hypothetical protein